MLQMSQGLPTSFFAPIPGAWQLCFWGVASLLGLLFSLSLLNDPDANMGGAAIGFLGSAAFAGWGVATWVERRRRQKPALVITRDGLSFWPGSSRQRFLPWMQLEKAWVSDGGDPHVVFQPTDLKQFGSRTLLFFRTGPSVPLGTTTRDGVALTEVLVPLWDQCEPSSTHDWL